nr:DUF2846 domain-containing protein [Xanthomonadaceae bacterium]
VLALSGAAFATHAQDAATAPAEQTQTAPAAAQPAPAEALPEGISAPPEGMGQIVFFRPSKMLGAAIGFIVREGEEELGKLRNATYFVHATAPGQHSYVVHSEAKDVMNIEVEAGETYFVSGSLSMGVLAGRPNLSPSDQSTFEAAAKKLKPSKPLKPKK